MLEAGSNWAFYGTLRDLDILEAVVGHDMRAMKSRYFLLHGWAAYHVEGELYPGIRSEAHASLPLTLYQNLAPSIVRRLCAYEGDEYEQDIVLIEGKSFHWFIQKTDTLLSRKIWELEAFQLYEKANYMRSLGMGSSPNP